MKIKAAILVNPGKGLTLADINTNKLLEGQVLVRIIKSGLCRSQLFEIEGLRGKDKWLPHLLGHEAIGQVVETGPSVSKVKINDYVILSWIASGGISAQPAKYYWNDKIVNGGQVTCFSDYSVCSENKLVSIDRNSANFISPSIGCALPTGYGIAITQPEIKQAKYVGILGLGGIGMSALFGVTTLSKAKTIAIDVNNDRLLEASKLKPNYLVNSNEKNLIKEIEEITCGNMLDVLIECSGSIIGLNSSLSLINEKGIVKFATHPRHGDLLTIDPFELIKGKRIEGSWGGGISPDTDLLNIVKQVKSNYIFNSMMNEKQYEFNDINQAIADFRAGKVLRPVINISSI